MKKKCKECGLAYEGKHSCSRNKRDAQDESADIVINSVLFSSDSTQVFNDSGGGDFGGGGSSIDWLDFGE